MGIVPEHGVGLWRESTPEEDYLTKLEPSLMGVEIELEDQRRMAEIIAASDWPTTSRLMNERDAWYKKHRRWDPETEFWVPTEREDERDWQASIDKRERDESLSILDG